MISRIASQVVWGLACASCVSSAAPQVSPPRESVDIARPAPLPQSASEASPDGARISLAGARYWLLDANGTFDASSKRGGAWLVSLVTEASADSAGHELAANLRAAVVAQGNGSWSPNADELATLPGYVVPPEKVWILSEERSPCAAEVDPSPRLEFYDHGVPAMEVAHAIRGCALDGAVDVGISGVELQADLRFRPARLDYERTPESEPDASRPWEHPLAALLISEPDRRPPAGEFGPGRQTIRLSGVDSEPRLLNLFTGVVWDHAPKNEDDYDACKAVVITRHELGFLNQQSWQPLPTTQHGVVHLVGAAVVGSQVAAVIGVQGGNAAVLDVTTGAAREWTLLRTGVKHDESAVFDDPRIGPYCGP